MSLLIDAGSDINLQNRSGSTPLIAAVLSRETQPHSYENSRIETVKLLVDRGADVNIKDNNGFTALITASHQGRLAVVTTLLEAGAEAHHTNKNGLNALTEAICMGFAEVVTCLLTRGATPPLVWTTRGRSKMGWAPGVGVHQRDAVRDALRRYGTEETMALIQHWPR